MPTVSASTDETFQTAAGEKSTPTATVHYLRSAEPKQTYPWETMSKDEYRAYQIAQQKAEQERIAKETQNQSSAPITSRSEDYNQIAIKITDTLIEQNQASDKRCKQGPFSTCYVEGFGPVAI